MYYKNYLNMIVSDLESLQVTDEKGNVIENEKAFDIWVELTNECQKEGRKIYFVGNGASSMMAGHMSADATKNGSLKCIAFNETAIMTAISNDICYNDVFSFQIDRFMDEGDYLFAISSSGNSQNIVNAIKAARAKKGNVVTISGLKENNTIRKMGCLNFYVPSKTYGTVEINHQALLHIWLDKYLDVYKEGKI